MYKFLIGLCVCSCFLPRLLAWNAEGHMVVAQVAYNHLNPVARARCDTLIATPIAYASNYNNTFVTAACWADDIKGSTSAFNNWHYIDIPFSLDGTPTNGVGNASFDVVRAIRTNILYLQSSTATLSNQAVHLRLLLHFVGDIQQPLHCSTAVSAAHTGGDAGGNSFFINGDWSNLHSLWDSGGGFLTDSLFRPLSVASQNTLNAKVTAIEAAHPYSYATNPGVIANPMNWAQEGFGLAQTISYVGITQNTIPSSTYLDTATATANQRMAEGGHRLADLLNTIYPAPPILLSSMTLTNGNFKFSWNAVTGNVYKVQWKGLLTNSAWNDLTNLTAAASSISFSDKLTQTQRFYGVMQ